ncbi:MAG TPA: hypothetical protein VEP50_12220 [bacterium]|nr:hypothetical protein [bacterium]
MASISVVPDIQRLYRQLHRLNAGCVGADDKLEVRNSITTKWHELQMLHELLSADLRRKSWLLTLERHDLWGQHRPA